MTMLPNDYLRGNFHTIFTLLEAIAYGVPVIVTNRTSVPEAVGDAAQMVHPYSVEAIWEVMIAPVNNQSLRADMIAIGFQRVRRFTWDGPPGRLLKLMRMC